MGQDIKQEAEKLLSQGKTPAQARLDLESKGYSVDDVVSALSAGQSRQADARTSEERKNSRLLGLREVFDRVGYGGATPQFINILFWLSQQTNPFILVMIGLLNGLKTLISVLWSNLLQEYAKLNSVSKNTIAAGGIIFGFSMLVMSFALLLGGTLGVVLFSAAFLIGTLGIVAYGDLYQRFVQETIRKERMGGFLKSIAHWGIVVTAASLVLAGFLTDYYPMAGVPWDFVLFGKIYHLKLYGYLLAFEITAFAFIIAGYVSSLISDRREQRNYAFWRFTKEHLRIVRSKIGSLFQSRYVALLFFATILSGIIQIIITAYSGIAVYQVLAKSYSMPFFILAIVYVIAIITSFLGPLFTSTLQRSTGFTPMLVFGTLLSAILPFVIVYNPHLVTITVALCLYVIGGSITGVAQGLLAKKLLDDETRRSFYQAQSYIIIIPYIILIPLIAFATLWWSINALMLVSAIGLVAIVMPLYFVLVTISQKARL